MSDMTKTLWGQFMTAFQDQIKIEGVPQMLTGPTPWNCSGQLIPDSDLGFSSATAGAIPPL